MAADNRRRKNRTAGDLKMYTRDTMKAHPTKNEETVRLRSYGSVGYCREIAVVTHREGFARNSSAESSSKPEIRLDINMGATCS